MNFPTLGRFRSAFGICARSLSQTSRMFHVYGLTVPIRWLPEGDVVPLVNKRDPGGWMSPANQKSKAERSPRTPVFTSRSEPVAHPTFAITGDPSMAYSRVALIGQQ